MNEKTRESLKQYFEENKEEMNDVMEQLDSYNGFLGDDRCIPMEELDDYFCNQSPTEILTRAFYGYDDTYDNHESSFNPNREYFYFNGYGNLVSTDEKDYSAHFDDCFLDDVEQCRGGLDLPSEVEDILDSEDETEE